MVSTPSAPDPATTAREQSRYNNQTAQTQQATNMVDQVGPDGKLTYSQNGTRDVVGADGQIIKVPRYTATTEYSEGQQKIYDKTQEAKQNLTNIAAERSKFLGDYLQKDFDFTNRDAENWAYDLASPRLLKQQAANEAQLRTTLANKGIKEGSAAFNSEMSRMTNANSDQMNQLALNGRNMAFQEALTKRNQPLQELSALMSGSQINQPQFQQTPQAGVGGVDYTGLVKDKYQADLARSQAGMGALGGLFGLLGQGMFSDRRLKRGVRRVGMLDNGLPVYAYQYVWGGPVQIGLMADEVAEIAPEAVAIHPSGFAMVDYGRAA